MVDLEGLFFALKYGEFGGINTIFFFGPKKILWGLCKPLSLLSPKWEKKFSQNKNKNHWTSRLV
jgi:hypothetical protein